MSRTSGIIFHHWLRLRTPLLMLMHIEQKWPVQRYSFCGAIDITQFEMTKKFGRKSIDWYVELIQSKWSLLLLCVIQCRSFVEQIILNAWQQFHNSKWLRQYILWRIHFGIERFRGSFTFSTKQPAPGVMRLAQNLWLCLHRPLTIVHIFFYYAWYRFYEFFRHESF